MEIQLPESVNSIYVDTCMTYSRINYGDWLTKILKSSGRYWGICLALKGRRDLYTIPEVTTEFEAGLEELYLWKAEPGRPAAEVEALRELISIEEDILSVLKFARVRNTFFQRQHQLYPSPSLETQVKASFLNRNGKTNELETDIKIVTAALNHARLEGVALLSKDQKVNETFMECAQAIPDLKETGIIFFDLQARGYRFFSSKDYIPEKLPV